MARAAWHLINDEGACKTSGDAYGNSLEEVLIKYYAYNYTKLNVLKVSHYDLSLPANQALEMIINQDSISKKIFVQDTNVNYNIHMGIGCACDHTGKVVDKTACYIVTAHHVLGKDILERVPTY